MAKKIRNLMDDPIPFEGGGGGGGGRSSGSYLKSQKVPLTAAGVGTAATVGTIYNDMKNAQNKAEAEDKVKREAKKDSMTTGEKEALQEVQDEKMRQKMKTAPTTKTEMGKPFAKGGMTASSRGDGCAQRGKTKGTMVGMKNGGMC
jgi:hypothetical protein